jgi:hypothetical protein
MSAFVDLTGLDIQGVPDENDKRSLAEVAALEASDRQVQPTQQTTELYLKLREQNTDSYESRASRLLNDGDFENEEERKGIILSENEFLSRLHKIVSIKPNDWCARGMRGLSAWKDGRYHYVCAMQAGYMPEFSLMYFDDHRRATKEKMRGWRTVLLNFILKGYITEESARREFGPPPLNRASRLYRETLWKYRHRENKNA